LVGAQTCPEELTNSARAARKAARSKATEQPIVGQ
jgi:hypothetical protein